LIRTSAAHPVDQPYGITSERKLVEELRMHLAWRWFTGLGFDQNPHHSTFSKNRHGRFEESKLFEELFEQIVKRCMEWDSAGQTCQSMAVSWRRMRRGEPVRANS
jgi:transposase